jgi:hypothetical protein
MNRMPKLKKINLKRRWINARPGSVLILVIALLVLLALIGTAYLSSTQTERYTSQQNTINTEADLLIQGMVSTVNSEIVNGLYGTSSSGNGLQYRPAYGEMPAGSPAVVPQVQAGAYFNYDSAVTDPNVNSSKLATGPDPADLWLADRTPNQAAGAVAWNNISWPLFKDASGSYTFDSPVDGMSLQVGIGYNKGTIQFYPTVKAGSSLPAMNIGGAFTSPGGKTFTPVGPGSFGGATAAPFYAADADGDGIADSLFCKVPVGQIDGVTYYVATRIIDNNSAINASSAFTQAGDVPFVPNPATNFGFFRSNIGIYELLNQAGGSRDLEMNNLNTARMGVTFSGTTATSPSTTPQLSMTPNYTDPTISATPSSNPSNYNWYSYGDIFENVLTRRPGNPGQPVAGAGGGGYQSQWLGPTQSVALAYKFALKNPFTIAAIIESSAYGLPNDVYTFSKSVPYAPSQAGPANTAGSWYNDLFTGMDVYTGATPSSTATGTNAATGSAPAFPLRTILTCNNAVSNACPGRIGNTTTPVMFSSTSSYNFGDWVTGADGFSYVCTVPAPPGQTPTTPTGQTGPPTATPTNPQYWSRVAWSSQPTKISINTAAFGPLWLGFAQAMTDTVGSDLNAVGGTQQWQPPMSPAALPAEPQLPQFRSSIRDSYAPGTAGRIQLSSSQMLKLRAALAAVNTIDLRGGTNYTPASGANTVTSKHIVLADPANANSIAAGDTGAFDVEVFGTKPQPYISEMVAQIEPVPANDYMAIELCNPYPFPLNLTNWALCSVDRTTMHSSGLTLTPLAVTGPVIIPAATASGGITTPGIAVIASAATPPTDHSSAQGSVAITDPTTNGAKTFVCPNLTSALIAGQEVILVRPRVYDGVANALTSSTDPSDTFTENPATGTGCAQMVPVDQIDLSGADSYIASLTPADFPSRLQYRRGSTPMASGTASYAWNFVYPGPYYPSNASTASPWFKYYNPNMGGGGGGGSNGSPTAIVIQGGTAIQTAGNLGLPDGPITGANGISGAATYWTAPIELANVNQAGPNPLTSSGGTTNVYPFGQFARNLDMLQIPFIGSYVITARGAVLGSGVLEMNSVSMDSTLAIDTTLTNAGSGDANATAPQATPVATDNNAEFYEQIGRFCPVGNPISKTLDFSATPVNYHYHWGEKLLNYFTVQSPQDDYTPNVDPAPANAYLNPPTVARYPGGLPPIGTANNNTTTVNAQSPNTSEDVVGVEGLININTAPAVVLAQLPFYNAAVAGGVPLPAGLTLTAANAQLAQSIVTDRNTNGPFKSIFDLYRVPRFRDLNSAMIGISNPSAITPTTIVPGPAEGIFTPGGLPTAGGVYTADGIRFDYKEQFLLLNNISNLITTKSDTFTCYILLQGWRNVGTQNPTLAVQRRAAYILDRNAITPSNNLPLIYKVPTD